MGQRVASPELKAAVPARPPVRGPGHDRLKSFVGRWKATGEAYGPAAQLTGEEVYEWLPGQFFLVYHFDRQIGDAEHKGIGILGYDAARQSYSAHLFDNLGYDRIYKATVRDGVWTFTGERERATFIFALDARSYRARWERTTDGVNWMPLCEFEATRGA